MATTKAAKSITINATKYELANDLAMNDNKIQLMANDVVLGEVEIPSGVDVLDLAMNNGKIQLLANDVVLGEVELPSGIDVLDLATNDGKIQLLANDVVLGEVELPSGADVLFFIRELDEVSGNWIVEVKNGKGETISNKADAYAIIEKGGMVYAVCHSDTRYNLPDSDTYIPMFASVGTASDFYLEFHKRWAQYEEPIMRVLWHDSTPTWQEFTYDGLFVINKTGMTSLSDLVVGDTVLCYGLDFYKMTSFFLHSSIILSVMVDNVSIDCFVIGAAPNEYGDRTFGVSFIASYNSEKYLIGLKYQYPDDVWTIGSLKAL